MAESRGLFGHTSYHKKAEEPEYGYGDDTKPSSGYGVKEQTSAYESYNKNPGLGYGNNKPMTSDNEYTDENTSSKYGYGEKKNIEEYGYDDEKPSSGYGYGEKNSQKYGYGDEEKSAAAAGGYGNKYEKKNEYDEEKEGKGGGGGYGGGEIYTEVRKEVKVSKHKEHLGELGTLAAGAFALYEKHEVKKDPEHAGRHKLEEEFATVATVTSGGYAFHEHHNKEDAEDKVKKQHEDTEKKHHFFD